MATGWKRINGGRKMFDAQLRSVSFTATRRDRLRPPQPPPHTPRGECSGAEVTERNTSSFEAAVSPLQIAAIIPRQRVPANRRLCARQTLFPESSNSAEQRRPREAASVVKLFDHIDSKRDISGVFSQRQPYHQLQRASVLGSILICCPCAGENSGCGEMSLPIRLLPS